MISLEKKPSQVFSKKLVSIKSIQHIQDDIEAANTKKMNIKISYLNQSYIFHLVAFWQVFHEDLAKYSFKQLERAFPPTPFRSIAKGRLDASLKKFNTPNRENIDKLFSETLGLEKVTRDWPVAVAQLIEDVLKARHSIAHTGTSELGLTYEKNFERMEVLFDAAERTERQVSKLLQDVHGYKNGQTLASHSNSVEGPVKLPSE